MTTLLVGKPWPWLFGTYVIRNRVEHQDQRTSGHLLPLRLAVTFGPHPAARTSSRQGNRRTASTTTCKGTIPLDPGIPRTQLDSFGNVWNRYLSTVEKYSRLVADLGGDPGVLKQVQSTGPNKLRHRLTSAAESHRKAEIEENPSRDIDPLAAAHCQLRMAPRWRGVSRVTSDRPSLNLPICPDCTIATHPFILHSLISGSLISSPRHSPNIVGRLRAWYLTVPSALSEEIFFALLEHPLCSRARLTLPHPPFLPPALLPSPRHPDFTQCGTSTLLPMQSALGLTNQQARPQRPSRYPCTLLSEVV